MKSFFNFTRSYRRGFIGMLLNWVQGWGGLLDGLVAIFSLGLVSSCFEFQVCHYRTIYEMRKVKCQK